MKCGSCLYHGHVYHKRVKPAAHVLRYRVYSLYLDIDKLDKLAERLWLFSRNRWNLFSFHDQDFGPGTDGANPPDLRTYVESNLQRIGIAIKPASIHLLCYPRVMGYAFNPLAVFYCTDERGNLFAVLHEVHNTFGERQVYAFAVNNENNNEFHDPVFTRHCAKRMHVSPFTPMQMNYQFRLNHPGDSLSLLINASDKSGLMLSASVTGKRIALTNTVMLKYFFTYPLLTIKVIAAIHWQALRLWLKRVPWFPHQPKSTEILK